MPVRLPRVPLRPPRTWYVGSPYKNGSPIPRGSADPGQTLWNAFRTLEEAIAVAGPGDNVFVENTHVELAAVNELLRLVSPRRHRESVISFMNVKIDGNHFARDNPLYIAWAG